MGDRTSMLRSNTAGAPSSRRGGGLSRRVLTLVMLAVIAGGCADDRSGERIDVAALLRQPGPGEAAAAATASSSESAALADAEAVDGSAAAGGAGAAGPGGERSGDGRPPDGRPSDALTTGGETPNQPAGAVGASPLAAPPADRGHGSARDDTRRTASATPPSTGSRTAASAPPAAPTTAEPAGTVDIGFVHEAQITVGSSIGATKNTNAGDTKAQAQAVIDVVNRTGGIAGRQVKPVWYKNDVNSGSYDARAQEACATFTEDHHVFAVVSTWVSPYRLADCLAQRRTPLISEARQPYDETNFSQLTPYLYMPGRMNGTRLNQVYVDELANQGFFSGAVVGLARFEGALYDRLAGVIKTRLQAQGVRLAAEATVRTPSSTTDFGGATAEMSNAILRFRTAGVTHVLFAENNGILPFFFLQEAESQGWRPRYGLNSEHGTETLEQYLPPTQLQGSAGVGWLPGADVNAAQESGLPHAQACDEIMRRAGIAYPERVAVQASRGYCDGLLFLQAALARTRSLSPDALRAGTEALGSSFGSALTFSTRFLPGRYDGASSVRHLAYEAACRCFRYRGQPVPIG
jgi:ABC-type branched-subunit amino acid transport system substrate-binding protein